MGTQGKMHGSPFHVENVKYMSAVEHQDTVKIKKQYCVYCSKKNMLCFNRDSQYCGKHCMDFKCDQYLAPKSKERCELWKEGICKETICTPNKAYQCTSFALIKGLKPNVSLEKKKRKKR